MNFNTATNPNPFYLKFCCSLASSLQQISITFFLLHYELLTINPKP